MRLLFRKCTIRITECSTLLRADSFNSSVLSNECTGGKLAFEDTFHPVAEVINGGQQYFESVEDMHTAIRGHIDRMGRAGILATGHARGFIEKWAQEVYTPATYQHLGMQDIFKMGHGVALFGARAAHEEVNEAIGASIEGSYEGPSSAASNDADTGDKE